MTTPTDAIHVHLAETAIAAMPHLLGFHPADSLVVLWYRDGAVLVAERVDLPPTTDPTDPRLPDWSGQVIPRTAVDACDATVVIIVTAAEPRLLAAVAFADCVIAEILAAGVPVLDQIHVCGARWRSLLCADPACCPAEGRTVRADLRRRVEEAFAFDGRRVLADRETMANQVAPDPARIAEVSAHLPRDPRRARRGDRWRDAAIDEVMFVLTRRPGPVPADLGARILRNLADIRVRDTVLWDVAGLTGDASRQAANVLTGLTRSAPDPVCAPVASCCAIAVWLTGDGALAGAAVERALAAEPDYSLAQLLAAALHANWPPSRWRAIVRELDRDTCRTGDLRSAGESV